MNQDRYHFGIKEKKMKMIKNYFLLQQGGVASEYSIVVALILIFAIEAVNLVGDHFVDNFNTYHQTS